MRTARRGDTKLVSVHARLFADDIRKLKQISEKKLIPWQMELRLLVRRALDIAIIDPNRSKP